MNHIKQYWIHYAATFFWIVGALVYASHIFWFPIEPLRIVILSLSILIISLVQYHEYKKS